jgi:Predicted membrane protein
MIEQLHTQKRIDIADVLRGLAVMGIIILHSIEHFNFYSFPDTSEQCRFLNFTDKAVWDSLFFMFGGKAYAVFALLFGFSFFIQDDNQRKRGKDFRLRFMWRLVLLFIIGNINAMFFTAEILVLYSILGFVLVLVCRLPDRVVFLIGLLLLLQPMEWGKMLHAFFYPDYVPEKSMVGYYFGKAYEVQKHGNFWETVKVNLWEGQLASLTWAWEHGRFFQTAALFIFGMLIGRRKYFSDTEKNKRYWFLILVGALICYFPLSGLRELLPQFIENKALVTSIKLILQSLANFSFMMVIVSGIILLFYTFKKVKLLLSKIIPYGRMSLTNYITQSIVGSLLFYNWGFGLHKYLGITFSFAVGILLFILQFTFCFWWMKHHRHGPLEFIWKKATWLRSRK